MQAVLDAVPEAHFFLATDHLPTEAQLRERFGDRILTYPKTSLLRHRQAMAEAMMDFLLLSRTPAVLGTHFSTYSEIAAKFGACPLVIANEENATNQLARSARTIVTALHEKVAR